MKEFQLSRYIKKWLPLIIVLCLGLTVAVYMFLSSSRMYEASAVIHYNDSSVEEGHTPLGTDFDVNEIKSSAIVSRVIDNLGLEGSYSVDELISRVTITAVPDEDKVAQKEAVLDEGKEYVYVPSTYIVSFSAKNGEGGGFARRVLDEILDLYFTDYSEKYINVGSVNNSLSKIYDKNYDYIEMMELIDENIGSTINSLYRRVDRAPYYRSTTTGMSFLDLASEFEYLRDVKVSELFSTIFEYQVTKDKAVLVSDYSTRIKNHDIESIAMREQIDDVVRLINAYVEKMRNSNNTNITYEYILDDVYDRDLTDADGNTIYKGDQTVTYDKLIYSWRDHNEDLEYAVIDSAYCQYIIDVFSKCTGACGGEVIVATPMEDGAEDTAVQTEVIAAPCASSDKTCMQMGYAGYDEVEAQVEADIRSLVDELEELYKEVDASNAEYNEYQGARNISTLSSSAVTESINVKLYTVIAAVFLLVVCCCGAILVGRLNDIVQYMFYTDHMTGLNNRVALDNFLKNNSKKVLDDGTVCATLTITNQVDFNRIFGREAGDELILLFSNTLKDVFRKTGASIFYNGNSHYVIFLTKTDYVTVEYILHRFRLLIDKREKLKAGRIEYVVGISETYTDRVHNIRGLLSRSFAAQTQYVSEPNDETVDAK